MVTNFSPFGLTKNANAAHGNNDLVIRNVTVKGRRTSIRLEPRIWDAIAEICRREFCTLHDVCTAAAERKTPAGSLTSLIRVQVLDYFRKSTTEDGHYRAGHGRGMFAAQQREREEARERSRTIRQAQSGEKAATATPSSRKNIKPKQL